MTPGCDWSRTKIITRTISTGRVAADPAGEDPTESERFLTTVGDADLYVQDILCVCPDRLSPLAPIQTSSSKLTAKTCLHVRLERRTAFGVCKCLRTVKGQASGGV